MFVDLKLTSGLQAGQLPASSAVEGAQMVTVQLERQFTSMCINVMKSQLRITNGLVSHDKHPRYDFDSSEKNMESEEEKAEEDTCT